VNAPADPRFRRRRGCRSPARVPAQRALLSLSSFVVALTFAGVARADVVAPPPPSCPDGSIGQSSHSGPYCWLAPCTNDEMCASYHSRDNTPRVCRPTAVCVRSKELWRKGGGKSEVPEAIGSCDGAAKCDPSAKCERATRCVPAARASTSSGSGNPSATPPTPTPPADAAPADAAPTATAAPPPTATGHPPDRPAGSDPSPSPAPQSSCFCSAPAPSGSGSLALSVAALAAGALVRRRRSGRDAR
jgi:MYXO-CTERM domain-containing protein